MVQVITLADTTAVAEALTMVEAVEVCLPYLSILAVPRLQAITEVLRGHIFVTEKLVCPQGVTIRADVHMVIAVVDATRVILVGMGIIVNPCLSGIVLKAIFL